MNGNATYRRLTLALARVGIHLGAASHKVQIHFKCGAAFRALAILGLLALVATAEKAAAQPSDIYVVNARSNTVSVIDRATNKVVTTIVVGSVPVDIAIAQQAARAYVANSGTNTVSVIDTTNNSLISTVQVGLSPVSILVADGRHAYVANARSNSVSVIDTLTQAVIATIPVGPLPNKLTSTPDGASIWVTNAGDHSGSIIDTASKTVTATVTVGTSPFAIVAPPPAPTCSDGMRDGFETDTDCGGPVCSARCASHRGCLTNSDCASNQCSTGGMGNPPPNTCF